MCLNMVCLPSTPPPYTSGSSIQSLQTLIQCCFILITPAVRAEPVPEWRWLRGISIATNLIAWGYILTNIIILITGWGSLISLGCSNSQSDGYRADYEHDEHKEEDQDAFTPDSRSAFLGRVLPGKVRSFPNDLVSLVYNDECHSGRWTQCF